MAYQKVEQRPMLPGSLLGNALSPVLRVVMGYRVYAGGNASTRLAEHDVLEAIRIFDFESRGPGST